MEIMGDMGYLYQLYDAYKPNCKTNKQQMHKACLNK